MKHSRRKGHSLWKTFWGGTAVAAGSCDPRTPPYRASYPKLFKAMCWGVTVPWNLGLSAILGIVAMFMGDFIPGALITVFSVIAWGEVTRMFRYLIIPMGLWLLFLNPALGVIAIVLSVRKGKIKEKYGTFKP